MDVSGLTDTPVITSRSLPFEPGGHEVRLDVQVSETTPVVLVLRSSAKAEMPGRFPGPTFTGSLVCVPQTPLCVRTGTREPPRVEPAMGTARAALAWRIVGLTKTHEPAGQQRAR